MTYHPISPEEARARVEERDTPPFLIEATLALAAYQKAGGPTAAVSGDVERILGRPPRAVRAFISDHVSVFRSPARTGEI